MRDFAALYEELDTTRSTSLKVAAMVRFFRSAPPADSAWAAWILSGRRFKRFIGPALLWRWLVEESGLPAWLVEESVASVGDLAETIALLLSREAAPAAGVAAQDTAPATSPDLPLSAWIEQRLLTLTNADEPAQRAAITGWWRELPARECFLLNKLLTGELRVGVSGLLATRALAEVLERPREDIALRIMGDWEPGEAFWRSLGSSEPPKPEPGAPYPFFLAAPLEEPPEALGDRARWLAEWKWDGIRSQLIRRAGQCFIWSRGEERITERFPEVLAGAMCLPEGCVLDGELVAWRDGAVRPFAELQKRIGRKKPSAAILADIPVHFLAYDLLEIDGQDLRGAPLEQRRARLAALLTGAPAVLGLSPAIEAPDWAALASLRDSARERGVEGLMLKRLDSPYGHGRQRGTWWKWKIDPHTFDGVLLYAQPGHGRRSNLYTDYTFGVWENGELVPVAKAYSGLTDVEIGALDRWIRAHTLEKFGPVRRVEPVRVFELAFEGIAASTRHRGGIALRFPRMLRERTDKPAAEADTLDNLRTVLAHASRHSGRPVLSS